MLALATLLRTIPPPPFRNIDIGGVVLHGYGLVMGLAIVIAIAVAEWGLKRQHVDPSRFTGLALVSVVAGFIGARLYHVASEPSHFWNEPADIPKIWEGGLGIYGAVIAGAGVGLWLAPRFGIPRRAVADAATPALLIAQAIGRVGNYLNQELFGRPFDGAWALEVDPERRPVGYEDVATFHPTFLYEQLGTLALAIVFAVLLVRWSSRTPGILMPLYIAAYSFVRLLVEPLRIDDAHEWLGVRQNVWVAGVLLLAGLTVALFMRRRDPSRRP
ncbi:MAG: lgt [Thermoleophilia bacterium]|nr:lgt [Thermoleophilia bacterium]